MANNDFRSRGTVAKSIEIATAAVEAGLPAQLWAVREDGPFRERVPGNVPVVQVGSSAAMPNRAIDLVQNIRFLGSEIGKRKPAVFLSGGNQDRKVVGQGKSGSVRVDRVGGRAIKKKN